jgi:hypothetical protein
MIRATRVYGWTVKHDRQAMVSHYLVVSVFHVLTSKMEITAVVICEQFDVGVIAVVDLFYVDSTRECDALPCAVKAYSQL